MDKKAEIKQFCKTMWIMTEKEFLPKLLLVGGFIGLCVLLYNDKGNTKPQNLQNIKSCFENKKQMQNAENDIIYLQKQK